MKKTLTMYLWIMAVIALASITTPALPDIWNSSTFERSGADDGVITTYIWDGSVDTDYQNANNWTPARTALATDDILTFDGAVTVAPIITNIPTQTVGQLLFINNVNATFGNGANAAGVSTLSVSGGSSLGDDSFSIAAGSTLTINGGSGTSTNNSVRIAGLLSSTGSIAGTLTLGGSTNNGLTLGNTTFIVTVSGTVNDAGTFAGATTTNLTFTGTSVYNKTNTTNLGNFPNAATWQNGSQTNIIGFTSASGGLSGFASGNNSFSNLTWNAPLQSGTISLGGPNANFTVRNTFTITSTGTGSINLSSNTAATLSASTVTVLNFTQSGGTLNLNSSTNIASQTTLFVAGTFNQSGGTITETGSSTTNLIEFNGATGVQNVTISGTISNFINYRVSNSAGINLTGILTLNALASLRISTTASPAISGAGTISYGTDTILIYDAGTTGSTGGNQTASAKEFPAAGGPPNLTINNPGTVNNNTVSIPFDRTITGAVNINDGIIDMGNNTLSLSSAATLTPTSCAINQPDRHVIGNLRKTFGSNASFTFTVGTADGCTPVDLTSVTAAGNPNLTVRAVNTTLNGLNPPRSLSRYWAITPSDQGTLSAVLTFKYRDDDINGNEGDYRIYKRETAGAITNQCPNAPCVDTFSNTVTLPSPTSSFSDWSAGELFAPTAASVNVGGRVRQSNGRGVFRARVTMTDSSGNVRMAFTNQFGYFRFDSVPAGENYVFSATHRRYQFAQPTQVRFIGEETDGIDFTVTGENENVRPEATFFDNAPFHFDGDGKTDAASFSSGFGSVRQSINAIVRRQQFGLAGDPAIPSAFDK